MSHQMEIIIRGNSKEELKWKLLLAAEVLGFKTKRTQAEQKQKLNKKGKKKQ